MRAFLEKGKAIARGAVPKKYDYVGAYMRIQAKCPKSARLGMVEDWGWTSEEIWNGEEFLVDLKSEPKIAGIRESVWATPTLEMDGEKEPCWIYGEWPDDKKRNTNENF